MMTENLISEECQNNKEAIHVRLFDYESVSSAPSYYVSNNVRERNSWYLFVIGPQYLFSCFRFISERKLGHNKKTGEANISLRVARMRLSYLEWHHIHSGLSATYVQIDTRVRVRVKVIVKMSIL